MKISDYAFLSDCQTAALVSRNGSVDWYCLPRFDSPSVFARLLDPEGGHWLIRPRAEFTSRRSYLGETLVLQTEFSCPSGRVTLTDALAFAPHARGHEIGKRVPHVLLRRLDCLEGAVPLTSEFSPRFEYGLSQPRFQVSGEVVAAVGGPIELRLFGPVPWQTEDDAVRADFEMLAGQSLDFSLHFKPAFSAAAGVPRNQATLEDTLEAWRSWMAEHPGYQGLYRQQVRRSALVLQGLTYQPSGAIIAAATSSLPEIGGGDSNWDYRYAWLRDLSLMINALWVAACPDEPERFFEWIDQAGGRLERGTVQIMFGVEGERDLTERTLEHLDGFAGSRPVRVGNDAWRQKQLDVLGEVLDAAYLLRERLQDFGGRFGRLLKSLANHAAHHWQEPDAGMWEARDRERHYLSTKLMCWVALDRAVKLAAELDANQEETRLWQRERDRLRQAILTSGWNRQLGAFSGAFGSANLDASVLLMPLVGFLPADDKRMWATIALIEKQLAQRGLVRRWAEEPNGFIICSYWLVECLALAGQIERARSLFEQVSACANDLGLLAEQADINGELWGNFPQAFSHVGLINAAWRLTLATTPAVRPEGSRQL